MEDWLEGLPAVLAAQSLKQLRDAIVAAHAAGRPVLAAIGGHVIKTGCGPYLNDWIARGVLTGVAMNGSAAIHDLELAIAGHTSEDVGPRLMAGTFGFARRPPSCSPPPATGRPRTGTGWGRPGRGDPGARRSGARCQPLVAALRHRVPATVHVAIGTDIVHMTPRLDGAALGRASLDDFRTLCGLVARLEGGVWLNLGSAVIMPESSSRPSRSPATWASPWTA